MVKKKFKHKPYKRRYKKPYKRLLKKKFIRRYYLYKKQIRRSVLCRRQIFKLGKMVIKKRRKKTFFWKKKKKHKRLRHRHNFIFFFSSRKKKWPRISRRWFIFQYKILKKSPVDILRGLSNVMRDLKVRFRLRLKNKVLKKRALIIKLRRYYVLTVKEFKDLNIKLKKKKKHRVIQLLFLLEFKLASVCLRFHFFWTIKKSYYWVNQGVVAVNNFISLSKSNVQVNDFIKIVGPQRLWRNRLVKLWGLKRWHTKFYYAFNYSELIYLISSGIIIKIPTQFNEIKSVFRKKRKTWLNSRTFLYIVNSFY